VRQWLAGPALVDEGLKVLTALLSGGPVDHDGVHSAVREVQFRPASAAPIWLGGRIGNRASLRRAARHAGFFVIGLDRSSAWTGPTSSTR
jgi:alkanesulfonate monooxygenase SsuD/methylene tetrahydromethanopterin reductase-like flavin-dependent oxidoreductase (luciferase family)